MNGPGHYWRSFQSFCTRAETYRYGLLLCFLVGGGWISLFYYFLDPPVYERGANLLATAVFWSLAMLVPQRRAFEWIAHLGMFTAVALMAYIASRSGGISSPAMVWMTTLSVPALLVLGRRSAKVWLGLIMLVLLVQFAAVNAGLIAGTVDRSGFAIAWAGLDKLLVILSLMVAVHFYERMQQRQLERLKQSNLQLEQARQALVNAQSHKDEFIASVGHELRTPMNAILGLNSVLQTEFADEPEQRQMARHIRESTEQLLMLVNDILDFSQLEAGTLRLVEQPVRLETSLRRLIEPFLRRAHRKGLAFEWSLAADVPEWVMADEQRLHQILFKLLDNAVKFTSEGQITLMVDVQRGRLRLKVMDTGRGIPLDRQREVFKRFEHADLQVNRAYGGTGLGLAICDHLVRLHGGQMGVRSKPMLGALFWFELPLRPVMPPDVIGLRPTPLPSTDPLRILLVDDNPVNLMVAQLALEKHFSQAEVCTACSGAQALALLDTEPFDLLLMDMVMPDMDGLETTRRLRAHTSEPVARIPVIGLTANSLSRERELCLYAGMNEVLVKPLDPMALREAVERLTGLAVAGGLHADA